MKFNGSSNIRNIKRICMEKKLLEGKQVEKYFWPGKITQHIYQWQILPIIFNLVYGRMFQMNFQ